MPEPRRMSLPVLGAEGASGASHSPSSPPTRRRFLADVLRGSALAIGGGMAGYLMARPDRPDTVWQIDPALCTQCGKCATHCVLNPSAVKCVQVQALCGFCDLCTGYFEAQPNALNTGAENQLCPTGAIRRRFIEDVYYEYTIDEPLCIGCARCVLGCEAFGNGSMFLQINQALCLNCNQCSIARDCPPGAISRVPADQPYRLRTRSRTS